MTILWQSDLFDKHLFLSSPRQGSATVFGISTGLDLAVFLAAAANLYSDSCSQ